MPQVSDKILRTLEALRDMKAGEKKAIYRKRKIEPKTKAAFLEIIQGEIDALDVAISTLTGLDVLDEDEPT